MSAYDSAYGWTGVGKGLEGLVEGLKYGMSKRSREGEQLADQYSRANELAVRQREGSADRGMRASEQASTKDYHNKYIQAMREQSGLATKNDILGKDIERAIKGNPMLGMFSQDYLEASRAAGKALNSSEFSAVSPEFKAKWEQFSKGAPPAAAGSMDIPGFFKRILGGGAPAEPVVPPVAGGMGMEVPTAKPTQPARRGLVDKYRKLGTQGAGTPMNIPGNE